MRRFGFLLILSLPLLASSSCQETFPDVLSSETSITVHGKATVKESGSDLSTPYLNANKQSLRCDNAPCQATGSSPQALKPFVFQESSNKNTIEITADATFTDADIPNLIIAKDNITLTFDAPPPSKGFNPIQKIGSITDHAKNTAYIFRAGDYHIQNWTIDNNPDNQKNPIINDHVVIRPQGNTRLFLKENFTVRKFTPPYPADPVISINARSKTQTIPQKLLGFIPAGTKQETIEPKPKELMIYAMGDIAIDTLGNYAINAILYGYQDISINADNLSRFKGAIHAKEELTVGSESNPNKPNGTFVYDPQAVCSLYRLDTCLALPEEPDPDINNATLLGIDGNRNGVRDDVELYIVGRFSKEEYPKTKTAIAMQYARATQKIIVNPERAWEDRTYEWMDGAQYCQYYWEEGKTKSMTTLEAMRYPNILDDDLDDQIFNTKERLKAYFDYNADLSGHIFDGPLEYTLNYCEINIDELGE